MERVAGINERLYIVNTCFSINKVVIQLGHTINSVHVV